MAGARGGDGGNGRLLERFGGGQERAEKDAAGAR
jgi:hypothetical protein